MRRRNSAFLKVETERLHVKVRQGRRQILLCLCNSLALATKGAAPEPLRLKNLGPPRCSTFSFQETQRAPGRAAGSPAFAPPWPAYSGVALPGLRGPGSSFPGHRLGQPALEPGSVYFGPPWATYLGRQIIQRWQYTPKRLRYLRLPGLKERNPQSKRGVQSLPPRVSAPPRFPAHQRGGGGTADRSPAPTGRRGRK